MWFPRTILLCVSAGIVSDRGLCSEMSATTGASGFAVSEQRVLAVGDPRLKKQRGLLYLDERPFSGALESVDLKGVLRVRESYVDGKRDGKMSRWYAGGEKESEREYRDNLKHGKHEGWYPNGQTKFRMQFVRGRYAGERCEWFESGKKLAVFRYVDGREEGLQRVWDEGGKLRSNYVVRNGRRYGLVGAKPCVSVPGLSESGEGRGETKSEENK